MEALHCARCFAAYKILSTRCCDRGTTLIYRAAKFSTHRLGCGTASIRAIKIYLRAHRSRRGAALKNLYSVPYLLRNGAEISTQNRRHEIFAPRRYEAVCRVAKNARRAVV
nr:hypothetical protein [uncultured Campylobacter sp.]